MFRTDYANARQLIAWVLGLGDHARVTGPPELVDRARASGWACSWSATPVNRTSSPSRQLAQNGGRSPPRPPERRRGEDERCERRRGDPARAVRPAGDAGLDPDRRRPGGPAASLGEVCRDLKVTESELREDISVLNVVNFGAGTYVLYAEITDEGTIEVDPEPYGDSFDRPARLLPVEAKALVAAIDLIGEHIPGGLAALGTRQGRRRARRGSGARGSPGRRRPAATTTRSRRSCPGRSPRGGCSRSSTTRRTRTSSPSARSSRMR